MADAIVNHCTPTVHICVKTYDTLLELALKIRALACMGQSPQFIESSPEVMVSYWQVLEDLSENMITMLDNIELDKQPAAN